MSSRFERFVSPDCAHTRADVGVEYVRRGRRGYGPRRASLNSCRCPNPTTINY